MQRGDIWFAVTPGGDRPVLVLTRDPVAATIGSSNCVVNFDNLHTLPREAFRRKVTSLTAPRLAAACRTLAAATGC